MAIECPACQRPCSKDEYGRFHIRFVLAKLRDEPEPSCPLFRLRTFRGLEGVVDHRRDASGLVDHGPLFVSHK